MEAPISSRVVIFSTKYGRITGTKTVIGRRLLWAGC